MTKRIGNFELNNAKKQKIDEDVEALWSDDLDEEQLDNLDKICSQVYGENNLTSIQTNNISISYNAFKEPKALFSSTQIPATSSKNDSAKPSVAELESQIKKLREQFEEKVGEVSILRTQLRQSKVAVQNEHQRTQNEWREKLNITQKEVKTAKSELEFKNFEIANLKQQILDVKKHVILDSTLNTTQKAISPQKPKIESKILIGIQKSKEKIQPIIDTIYPLKSIISPSLFKNLPEEKYIIETKYTKLCRNTIPYLQNQSQDEDTQSKNILLSTEKKELNINFVYPEIYKLVNCTVKEIIYGDNIMTVNKIICITLEMLSLFSEYLLELEKNIRVEDIQQADANYLEKNNFEDVYDFSQPTFSKDEIGIRAGQILRFFAELLPYSNYLKNYIFYNKPLVFDKTENYVKKLSCISNNKYKEQFYLLNKILEIVAIIGKYRKANVTTNFLCSVTILLTNICKSGNYTIVSDIFCKISKEVLFARPNIRVMYHLTFLYKSASKHYSFVEFMFSNVEKSTVETNTKKGVLFYNKGACCFYIFVMLFYNTMFKMKQLSIIVCLNMLSFIYNTYKWTWIHHQERKCNCLSELYKLEIEIVFKALEKYVEERKVNRKLTDDWDIFFKHKITLKVLKLMTFNNCELTEKYVTVYSQYKEIERKLEENEQLNEMDKLSLSEDIPEIPSNSFTNINF